MLNIAAVSAAYETVDCSTDTIFSENSCNQCFDWWEKATWDNIGMMEDLWRNDSSSDRLIYKEEQEMPKMVNPASDKVTWSQNPTDDKDFWIEDIPVITLSETLLNKHIALLVKINTSSSVENN